jgi:DNA polymerase-3 subunit alpha
MTMQSRAAIRDVGRVMDIPPKEVDFFANSIWQGEHNGNSAIQDSVENRKDGKAFAKKYPDAIRLILKMEGQVRGSSAHAAAVIISKEDLRESSRCVLVKRNNRIVCNWSMQDSEHVGLMKLDVLGLSTLSVLAEAKNLINRKDNPKAFYYRPESKNYLFLDYMARELEGRYKNCKQIKFDFDKIELNNIPTFKNISDGNTTSMFQLSGHACTELCKKMKIHSFEDIVAIVALTRPGPADSGMTKEYVERKHGKDWPAMHPIYEEVTKDTYGILVYQEQIMQVISKVAGLSESMADKIRKVIGKKRDPEEFKLFWKQFEQGCKKMNTLSKKEAEKFWEGLLKWSSYGFNRAHAVAYALIGYWTAYLKTHCKKEFFAASLTYGEWNEKSKDEKSHKNSLLTEVRQAGYTVAPPKKEFSDAIKWIFQDNVFYVPFIEIIGVGENNAEKCLSAKINTHRIKGFFGNDYIANAHQDTKINTLLKELKVKETAIIPSHKILQKYLPHIDFGGK